MVTLDHFGRSLIAVDRLHLEEKVLEARTQKNLEYTDQSCALAVRPTKNNTLHVGYWTRLSTPAFVGLTCEEHGGGGCDDELCADAEKIVNLPDEY